MPCTMPAPIPSWASLVCLGSRVVERSLGAGKHTFDNSLTGTVPAIEARTTTPQAA